MKKIYLFFYIISVISLFPACSEDNGQELESLNPVKNAIVPEKGIIGDEITVVGAGFTAEGRIYLKSTQGETEAEALVTGRTPEDITFKVPDELAIGVYDVILRQQGDWKLGSLKLIIPEQPVKDAVVPEKVIPGNEVTITGQGFNIISEIYLQQDEQEAVIVQVMNMDENGLTFFVPETFPEGDYRVILRQDGDWPLGTLKVKIPMLVKVVREGEDVLTRTFTYDDQKQIIAMQVKAENSMLELNYTLNYISSEQLQVEISGTDTTGATVKETQKYILENGRAVRQGEDTFDYNEKGFLIAIHGKETIEYVYEDNTLSDAIINGNVDNRLNHSRVRPPSKNNQKGIDFMAFVFDSVKDGTFNYEVEMRLWGISGKYSESLTNYVMEWGTWASVSYDYEYTGNLLSKILVDQGRITYIITYE